MRGKLVSVLTAIIFAAAMMIMPAGASAQGTSAATSGEAVKSAPTKSTSKTKKSKKSKPKKSHKKSHKSKKSTKKSA
jgi:hypothetical protein